MEHTDERIVFCTIGPMPKSVFDAMPEVTVVTDKNNTVVLFEYYPDELTFSEIEFIGLTVKEGRQLKFQKDKEYLQS